MIKAGLFVEKQKPMPLVYSQVRLDCGYRVDIMVERRLILEIKSVDAINDIHLAQVLTYLRLANCRLALLMNFNVLHLREGIGELSITTMTLRPLRKPLRPLRLGFYATSFRTALTIKVFPPNKTSSDASSSVQRSLRLRAGVNRAINRIKSTMGQ